MTYLSMDENHVLEKGRKKDCMKYDKSIVKKNIDAKGLLRNMNLLSKRSNTQWKLLYPGSLMGSVHIYQSLNKNSELICSLCCKWYKSYVYIYIFNLIEPVHFLNNTLQVSSYLRLKLLC